ncbi:DnaJ domain-containing protein [bacterium]|nr:DnaJ domain-containing protein [bacterium]
MPASDPYQVLATLSTAPDREIKEAYRKLARTHHPDVGGDPEEFKKIQEAYSLIGDPVKRAIYDLERRRGGVNDARKEATEIAAEYLASLPKRRPL